MRAGLNFVTLVHRMQVIFVLCPEQGQRRLTTVASDRISTQKWDVTRRIRVEDRRIQGKAFVPWEPCFTWSTEIWLVFSPVLWGNVQFRSADMIDRDMLPVCILLWLFHFGIGLAD